MSSSFLPPFFRWLSSALAKSPSAPVPLISTFRSGDNTAIVTQVIQPGRRGWVEFQATEWSAFCPSGGMLPPDAPVRVIGRINTTLVIEPLP